MIAFFNHVNIAISLTILIYLAYFYNNRKIAQATGISTFVPLLTNKQTVLIICGFMLWLTALILEPLLQSIQAHPTPLYNVWRDSIEVLLPALYVALTMCFAHALMYFAILPKDHEHFVPNLDHIQFYHWIGSIVLCVICCVLIYQGPTSFLRDPVLKFLFPMWQIVILVHTAWIIYASIHPTRNYVLFFLPLWILTVTSELVAESILPILNTISLFTMLTIILRTNFLYVHDTFRRAASFKVQKDVMITYLAKLGEEEEKNTDQESGSADEDISFLGGFDLDRMLSFTLEYGMELCGASAGAIYVHNDLPNLFVKSSQRRTESHMLTAHEVIGLYPPMMELGHQGNVEERMDYIYNAVRAEQIPVGERIIGQVAQNGTPILIPDAEHDLRIQQQHEPKLRIRTMIAIPLKVQHQTIAVLSFINKTIGDDTFSQSDEATLVAMAEQAAITIGSAILHQDLQAKERLERELEFAREVQSLLLPNRNPALEGFDIAGMSIPAQDVGGDYYDFIPLDQDRLAIVIADVSGKGFPAALTMASLRSALRSRCIPGKNARDLLIEINQFLVPDMRREMFITLSLMILDTSTGQTDIVRAGHDPGLLYHPGQDRPEELNPTGMALGMVNGELFSQNTEEQHIQLQNGDMLVLYTDGVTEAMNPSNEEYSLERLQSLLVNERNNRSEDTLKMVSNELFSFAQGRQQHDDQTMIVLKCRDVH